MTTANPQVPTLPQNDPAGQQARAQELASAQTTYTFAHSYTYRNADGQPLTVNGKPAVLQPIAVLTPTNSLPLDQLPTTVQLLEMAQVAITLVTNFLVKLTNLLDFGAVKDSDALTSIHNQISQHLQELDDVTQALHKLFEGNFAHDAVAIAKAGDTLMAQIKQGLSSIASFLDHPIGDTLSKAGLQGPASSMKQYDDQFQTIVLPDVASTTMSDALFARLRVAGPNPLVIKRIAKLPDIFPVSEAGFQAVMGADDTLLAAGAEGRLYLADYAVMADIEPGSFPQPKYVMAPLALFAVPKEGAARNLRPVAIQCEQQPSASNPVFYPSDGARWELAKTQVEVADGNYEEMISHLGRAHLLLEAIIVSTYRELPPQHPVFVLLLPSFQGTLFINNQAIFTLIQPGGWVDRLLGGPLTADWALAAGSLVDFDFNTAMLPNELANRGVLDPLCLPSYPYRDDGLLLWEAIHAWALAYLQIYYTSDADVVGDTELQAWYRELVSPEGGCIKGLGEDNAAGQCGLFTVEYLAEVLTMILFTASVQHAVVNFGQRTVMSYTPAMPLAAYSRAPLGGEDDTLSQMPPLQQALIQMYLGQFLGGVYFTRLGQYDRYRTTPYFVDERVAAPLKAFQAQLLEIERTIGVRNLERPDYTVMLPSRIPQSINI